LEAVRALICQRVKHQKSSFVIFDVRYSKEDSIF